MSRRKLLFAFLPTLLLLFAGEVGVRVHYALRQKQKMRGRKTISMASMFAPHPYCVYVANPDREAHTAQGFRGGRIYRPRSTNGQVDLRVACFGGSSTYGSRVREPDSYPRQLEKLLNRRQRSAGGEGKVEVINAGLNGYSTPNIISLLALRVVDLKPDVAIFYVGFNDAWNRILFSGYRPDYSHAQTAWRRPVMPWWRRSMLLDKIADEVFGSPSPRNPHLHTICWRPHSGLPAANWKNSSSDAFARNLVTLIAVCRAHGITPVFCTQAVDFANHPLKSANDVWRKALSEYSVLIRSLAKKHGVGLVDLAASMSGRREYFADCLHMTAQGNRERARIVAGWLRENIADFN